MSISDLIKEQRRLNENLERFLLHAESRIESPMSIIPSGLATLDGWTWKTEIVQERQLLTRGGGETPLLPSIQGEKGWIHTLGVIFSDPMSELRFQCDNWAFTISPFMLKTVGEITPNNDTMYCSVYDPATMLGPMYGMRWSPSQFWPYRTQLTIHVRHPAMAPTATSQIVAFALGRHYIRDERQFYESITREGDRQTISKVEVPVRR